MGSMYYLIMTLIITSPAGSSGGVDSIANLTKEQCNRMGKNWINKVAASDTTAITTQSFFTCEKQY